MPMLHIAIQEAILNRVMAHERKGGQRSSLARPQSLGNWSEVLILGVIQETGGSGSRLT